MEYFAGLDVSMKETHICVVDRDGEVVLETKAASLPETIAIALGKAPGVSGLCSRQVVWRQCSIMALMPWACR